MQQGWMRALLSMMAPEAAPAESRAPVAPVVQAVQAVQAAWIAQLAALGRRRAALPVATARLSPVLMTRLVARPASARLRVVAVAAVWGLRLAGLLRSVASQGQVRVWPLAVQMPDAERPVRPQ